MSLYNTRIAFIICIIFLLSACATTPKPSAIPYQIPGLTYQDIDQKAYLWTSGKRKRGFFDHVNYATFTKINDVSIPSEFLPRSSLRPFYSWILEIPSGNLTVEILYKEIAGIEVYHERSRHTLTFTAEPNRTYAPFASDECVFNFKEYFWIEDSGLYVAGSETKQRTSDHESNLTRPVIAGEAPNKDSCETSDDN